VHAEPPRLLDRLVRQRRPRGLGPDGAAVAEERHGEEIVPEQTAADPHEREDTPAHAAFVHGRPPPGVVPQDVLHDRSPTGEMAEGAAVERADRAIPFGAGAREGLDGQRAVPLAPGHGGVDSRTLISKINGSARLQASRSKLADKVAMQPDDTPPPKPRPRRWARIIGWSWALFLLLATLTSVPVGDTAPPVGFATCLICGERGAADAILNIFLFVPLGLVVGARLGLLRAFALGAGLSAMIEVTQTFLSGRYATLGDVVWNATGALVGVVLYRALAARAEGSAPREPAATMLPILTGLVVLIGGWLLGSAPTDEAYWGQWTPDFGTGTRYPGAVLDARFNAHPFPSARLPASWSGADMLRTDWTLEGSVLKEGVPRSYTSVLSIYDGQQREILYLGAFRE